jgi:hypothetical protein
MPDEQRGIRLRRRQVLGHRQHRGDTHHGHRVDARDVVQGVDELQRQPDRLGVLLHAGTVPTQVGVPCADLGGRATI